MSRSNADVPVPPWRKSRKSVPLRRQLSQDLIVEAGLRILDAEGLDGLSMRRVAQELDTGPASLYAHVANKEELLELIYDRVLGEIRLPEPDPSRWKEQLREYAIEVYRVLGEHADVARAGLASVPMGPNALRVGEYVFGLLIEAGMTPRDAALGVDRLALYISGDAYEGSLHFAKMRAAGQEVEEYFRAFVGQIEGYYRSLPAEMFPHTTKHVDVMIAEDGRARFEFGLDLLLDGLTARMP
ncbi:TetR/AcrR family transcriptional regulator [Nonomuraea rhizosphaerae]|uniref:TetR/AcrR family transcriptional regulator n=1 Tax=Nonomuraea rhizosphaerae TaxID=2665663 RepID=UPI001FE97C64|nr:TetR/AcrR family transcriptional regulator C-terminal domain-containing protein [Nonomuraea rhizosphaerae]